MIFVGALPIFGLFFHNCLAVVSMLTCTFLLLCKKKGWSRLQRKKNWNFETFNSPLKCGLDGYLLLHIFIHFADNCPRHHQRWRPRVTGGGSLLHRQVHLRPPEVLHQPSIETGRTMFCAGFLTLQFWFISVSFRSSFLISCVYVANLYHFILVLTISFVLLCFSTLLSRSTLCINS